MTALAGLVTRAVGRLVTVDAGRIRGGITRRIFGLVDEVQDSLLFPGNLTVAAPASDFGVASHQRKRRLEMVEELDGESLRAVTAHAIRRIGVAMGILVTPVALHGEGSVLRQLLLHADHLHCRHGMAAPAL